MQKKMVLVVVAALLTGCAGFNMENSSANLYDVKRALANENISNAMDKTDQAKLEDLVATATQYQNVTWQNHNDGDMFEFTSLKIYINKQGQPCREYRLSALVSSSEQKMQAIACRANDTGWKMVKSINMT